MKGSSLRELSSVLDPAIQKRSFVKCGVVLKFYRHVARGFNQINVFFNIGVA